MCGRGWNVGYRISIHALRVEGDRRPYRFPTWPRKFLSTPSGWRATLSIAGTLAKISISIHALRVEGDGGFYRVIAWNRYFYPRPPGGGRLG